MGKSKLFRWWLEKLSPTTYSPQILAAHGKGGQRILVIPELDAVVVCTDGHCEDNASVVRSNKVFAQHVLPLLLVTKIDWIR